MMCIELKGVTEYCEELPVNIIETTGGYNGIGKGRLVIQASNECGHNSTEVDLAELIDWLKIHMPERL